MRRSKYGAVRTTVDGITFASKKEAARYSQLRLLVKAKIIHHLELQPRFPLIVNGEKIGSYVADFLYWQHGTWVTEDVKGVRTSTYRIKAKLLKALYGITIKET